MPSYKTHSIHGELSYQNINKEIEVDLDYFKIFCMGPDILIASDPKIFNYQHENKVKEYFTYLIKYIKNNKLYNSSQVMAYLYGHLDHYVLDVLTHPLIYYMTENFNSKSLIKQHGLTEMWIDDYICKKYNKNDKNYKCHIDNPKLKDIINNSYNEVFNKNNEALCYSLGLFSMNIYDSVIRRNPNLIPFITKMFKIGEITYNDDLTRVIPFLNLNNELWYNPETKEYSYESFDNLWDKSFNVLLESIDDVNGYIYHDKKLINFFINNDISYNTGLSCNEGQILKYLKKY